MNSRAFAEHEDHRLGLAINDSGLKLKAGQILGDLRVLVCNDGCKWLYFLVPSDRAN